VLDEHGHQRLTRMYQRTELDQELRRRGPSALGIEAKAQERRDEPAGAAFQVGRRQLTGGRIATDKYGPEDSQRAATLGALEGAAEPALEACFGRAEAEHEELSGPGHAHVITAAPG